MNELMNVSAEVETTTAPQETAIRPENLALRTIRFIQKHRSAIMCCLMATSMIGRVAFAGDGGADGMWTTMTGLISKWVLRLGGVVVFVGGIMFALGWKSDDADQKTRGIQTMVAGAMVAAIAGSASLYMNYGGAGDD